MDTESVSIAKHGDLFIIPCGKPHGGYTTLGFDEVQRRTRAVAEWLRRPSLLPVAPRGTLDSHAEYMGAMRAGQLCNHATGARCLADLHPKLIGLEGRRVEVTYQNGTKERFQVGRSTGWYPSHLALHNQASRGGMAISVHAQFTVRVIR